MSIIIEHIENLVESWDLEVKAAQGANGRGALPHDLWPTYSAFANSKGGYIVLGAEELPQGKFNILGIKDSDRVLQDFWNTVSNTNKVNVNLLQESDVKKVTDPDNKSCY